MRRIRISEDRRVRHWISINDDEVGECARGEHAELSFHADEASGDGSRARDDLTRGQDARTNRKFLALPDMGFAEKIGAEGERDAGSRWSVYGGYILGSALMIAAAVIAARFCVAAERKPLEAVAKPLAAVD
jgi:hypothetical protein